MLALCLAQGLPAGAADVAVVATRDGDVLQIEASADFEGTLGQTWQVLTDYDNLASFIPNLTVSRVIARARDSLTLEQKGEARLLFLSYPIEVRLVVTEVPQTRVVSRAVAGNFREMSGTYAVEASGSRVKLRYSGRLVPAFYVPPLIGTWVLRNNVETTFGALVDEIVRRQAVNSER
jgi:hypothetical protein